MAVAAAATATGGDAAAAAIPRRVAGPTGEGGSRPQGAPADGAGPEVREAAQPPPLPAGDRGGGREPTGAPREPQAGGGERARARKKASERERGHPQPAHPPENSSAHGAAKYVWTDTPLKRIITRQASA